MMPFNGDKIRPILTDRMGNKTCSWLFDTGASVTCMNKQSCDMAFGHLKPRKISEPQSFVAASGDKMSSLGIFELDLFIKRKKFTHPVNVIKELNDNIMYIEFTHKYQLTYDMITCQVKLAGSNANSFAPIKQTVLPAMT